MYLFFISVFLIYGLVHLYAFLKARSALSFGRQAGALILLFMLVMVFAPFLVRIAEREGLERTAIFISHTGYLWMGLLFLFFSASLAVDTGRLALFLARRVFRFDAAGLQPFAGFSFFAPLMIALVLSCYGFYEARSIRVEKVVIRSAKLPDHIGRFRIAQISDVHLGLIVKEGRLKRIVQRVIDESPDMFVSTGDLLDGQVNNIGGLAGMLKEIQPVYGKYAITGNHEFYAGLEQSLDFTERAGFTILRGEGVNVRGIINVAGVDDRAGQRFGLYANVPEAGLLSELSPDQFTVLLKHRPIVSEEALGLFDLQLSGHTHKGQIFPFTLVSRFFYPKQSGLHRLKKGASLYVSRGSGTWGPPIRFLSPPEVTIIEIVNSEI